MSKFLKMSKFTKKLLKTVNQDEFADALWVLRHSFAAREVFADYQLWCHEELASHNDPEGDMITFVRECVYREALEKIAVETAHRMGRKCFITGFDFIQLKDELEVPSKLNEWGDEYLYRTILGWWQL